MKKLLILLISVPLFFTTCKKEDEEINGYGCTDNTASNYDATASLDDGSCDDYIGQYKHGGIIFSKSGLFTGTVCTDMDMGSASWSETQLYCDSYTYSGYSDWYTPSVSQLLEMYNNLHLQGIGEFHSLYVNYWSSSACECVYFSDGMVLSVGCQYGLMVRPVRDFDNSGCNYGCMDNTQFNYDPNATCDDGSCIPFIYGCIDVDATNFNSLANTDDGSCQYLSVNIGDYHNGGVVFYLKSGSQGQHGWVCDINDLPQSQWGSCCFNVPSGNLGYVGYGQENTDNMIAAGVTHGAAIECRNSNNQGFNDWFLPSIDELQQIYNQRVVIDATALSNGGSVLVYGAKYWSSTNWSTTDAYYFDTYGQGEQNMRSKFDVGWVRAVREF